MKFAVTIFAFVIISCNATQWRNIKSPLDTPHYRDVVSKLMPAITNDYQNKTITGRITNGTPAQLGQFPYQVYLYSLEAAGTYLCGASVSKLSYLTL